MTDFRQKKTDGSTRLKANFEEEIKKFHPSLEIGEVEEAIYNHDLTDLTDLLVEIEKSRKADKNRQE